MCRHGYIRVDPLETKHIDRDIHVKHHLNIFLEKAVKLSKHEIHHVTFLKGDKLVKLYSKV